MQESRTLAQIRSDEAVDVFRHVAACDVPTSHGKAPVTVIVRIGLEQLQSGVGSADASSHARRSSPSQNATEAVRGPVARTRRATPRRTTGSHASALRDVRV